jgi:conjugative transfer signal peptidase TraF
MKSLTRTGLCRRIRETDWRRTGTVAVLGSASLFGLFAITGAAGIRINTTPSLPVGLYVETDRQSRLVEFCPSGVSAAISAGRGYRGPGDCPDGASPLLKPIVAQFGDVVKFSAEGISVNRHLLRNTAPLSMDSERRPLEHFPFGRYVVGVDEVWVASSYNKRSFDSRYYGPVAKIAIRFHLRPLLTF